MFFRHKYENRLISLIEELVEYIKKSEMERLELLKSIRAFYEFSVKKYKQESNVSTTKKGGKYGRRT